MSVKPDDNVSNDQTVANNVLFPSELTKHELNAPKLEPKFWLQTSSLHNMQDYSFYTAQTLNKEAASSPETPVTISHSKWYQKNCIFFTHNIFQLSEIITTRCSSGITDFLNPASCLLKRYFNKFRKYWRVSLAHRSSMIIFFFVSHNQLLTHVKWCLDYIDIH